VLKPCFSCDLIAIFFLALLLPAEVLASSIPATDEQIVHLLNRVSFGPAAGDIETVRRMGVDAYLEQQLRPSLLPKSQLLDQRLSELSTLDASLTSLAEKYGPPPGAKDLPPDERKEMEKRQQIIVQELAEAKILRAILSPAQLQEAMVDFWFNHFNVFAGKGADKVFIGGYERDAIRPYALGKFRDLLDATAHHPAMLFYLDNWLNTDPNSIIARNRKIGINENYAREIMELHTLGVNGGYTQQDVTALARILTGWGLGEGREMADRAVFYFEPRRHDYGEKIWLSYDVRGAGAPEVEQALDILARHPSTAKHIAYELAQYFVADNPPQSLVDKLAAAFRSSDGDIATVLRTLFHAPEFWDAKYAQKKFKPPFRYVVSALRAADAVPPGDTRMIQGAIGQMGEPLYHCLTPNGYANTNDQWLNSDALLKRIDFAKKLSGFIGDDRTSGIAHALGETWSANTLATVDKAESKMKPILLLSSPEFVYY
jgi:uncharacterized protein (DUF1800 family)